MSENEKLKASSDEISLTISVEEISEVELETPQDSNPLEKESAEISRETEGVLNAQINAEEVEKGTDTQKQDANNNEKVHSYKELGAVVAACAMFTLSAGLIGLIGFNANDSKVDTSANEVYTSAQTTTYAMSNSEFAGTIGWWKAGIEEFDFVIDEEDDAVTTTSAVTTTAEETTTTTVTTTKAPETTTKAPETTTKAPETTTKKVTTTKVTTTQAKIEETEIEAKTFYLTTNVNLRKGAGTSYSKICTLSKNTEVKAIAKVSNGWYKVEANGKTGYIIDDYLTTEKPATSTVKNESTSVKETEKADSTLGENTVISYTDEELEMFYWVVEGEVGGCSEASKIAVANVIINRVKSPKFSNTLKGVMTAKSQFSAINNYYNRRRAPTKSTIDCVNRALNGEDNTNGAIYFYSVKYCSASSARWFESLTFCFEIDGQRYFKP